MPEIPDFEQIARQIAVQTAVDKHMDLAEQTARLIAVQLRQVWNARGAADLEAVNDIAHTNYERIETAIRALDAKG